MSKPPYEPLYYIEIAKECLDVAEGDVDRAMVVFCRISPEADEELRQAMREALSRLVRRKMSLIVTYWSPLYLQESALQTKLQAHVSKILKENKRESFEHYEGEIELAGIVHSFSLTFDGYGVRLSVLTGSFDGFEALYDAMDAALDDPSTRRTYRDEMPAL